MVPLAVQVALGSAGAPAAVMVYLLEAIDVHSNRTWPTSIKAPTWISPYLLSPLTRMRIKMSGGLQDSQTHDIHHRGRDPPFNEGIPSRDPSPAIEESGPPDPRPRSIETPFTVSAILNFEPEESPNRRLPLSLKQVGNLVGIFNHERGAPPSLSSSPII